MTKPPPPEFTGSDQDLKRMLRARFSEWSIIRSSAGRWWATRVPPKDDPCRISDLQDDSPAGLYVQLADLEAGATTVRRGSSEVRV